MYTKMLIGHRMNNRTYFECRSSSLKGEAERGREREDRRMIDHSYRYSVYRFFRFSFVSLIPPPSSSPEGPVLLPSQEEGISQRVLFEWLIGTWENNDDDKEEKSRDQITQFPSRF